MLLCDDLGVGGWDGSGEGGVYVIIGRECIYNYD